MDINPMLQPQAAECLQAWHAMIAQRDLSGLPELLHPPGGVPLADGSQAL